MSLICTGVKPIFTLSEAEIAAKIIEYPHVQLTSAQQRIRDEFTERKNYRAGCGKVKWNIPSHLFGVLQKEANARGLVVTTALDLAAGTGEVSSLVKSRYPGSHVIGVELARNKAILGLQDGFMDEAHILPVTRLSHMTQPPACDLVALSGAMEFISPEEVPDLAAGISVSLKSGGVFGLTFSPADSSNPGPKSDIVHHAEDLRDAFVAAGLEVGFREPRIGWNLCAAFAARHGEVINGESRPVHTSFLVGHKPALNPA